MATNPYFNKVVKDNVTIIDLTSDTVTPASVLQGVTFHDASGASCVGTGSGGGKTIDHINTANIPCEWTNVVAKYEMVCRDFDVASGNGSKVTRTYEILFANPQTSLDPADYGFSSAMPKRYSEWLDNVGPFINAKAPSGEIGMARTPTTTTLGTASGDDDNAWAAGIEKYTTPTRICYPDNSTWSTDEITSPINANVRKLTLNSDGTYDVEFTDDTTSTSGTYSGSVVSTTQGNECLILCGCVNVTGTPSAYAPAYLVTYTDNSTETFPAASGDIASGGY